MQDMTTFTNPVELSDKELDLVAAGHGSLVNISHNDVDINNNDIDVVQANLALVANKQTNF